MSPRTPWLVTFAVLYIAGSAWLVGRLGQSHREGIAKPPADASARADTDATPQGPARVTEPIAVAVAPPPPVAKTAPAPVEVPVAAPPIVPTELAKPDPPAPKPDPIWQSPQLTAVWDLAKFTPEEEMRFGRELNAFILHFNKGLPEGPWYARLDRLADPIIKSLGQKGVKYHFTVLDSNEVNAFSHPGRYIYLSRTLLDNFIGEGQDYALQFVIAHEIAHVELKHGLECLRLLERRKPGIGTLAQYYSLVLPYGYPEEQDYAADSWAYRRMNDLGRSRKEIHAFLRKFLGYAQTHGFENRRMEPRPGQDTTLIENHFQAHPIVRDRRKKLEELEATLASRPPG